jgi:DNA-binding NarL/FixJ family response regulator
MWNDERHLVMGWTEKTMKKPALSAPYRIFIVEDHPVFREGLIQIVNGETDMTVCGQAGDAETALLALPQLNPQLVLVDISLPGKSGLEFIREIRTQNRTIKMLVVSMHDEAVYANRVLRAGGDGYIMKQEDPEEIIHAMRDVLDGHIYLSERVLASTSKDTSESVAKPPNRPLDQLSDGELEILELLGRGKSHLDIGHQLHLKTSEVKNRCAIIGKKLNMKGANELIRYAVCWVETGNEPTAPGDLDT